MKLPREVLEELLTSGLGAVGYCVNLRQFLLVFLVYFQRERANIRNGLFWV